MKAEHVRLLVLSCILKIGIVNGLVRLLKPTQRSSLWRYGYNVPENQKDGFLNCGGFEEQWKHMFCCGVCGDSCTGTADNEAPGKYVTDTISGTYVAGTSIPLTVELSPAQQLGYFEFRLCPHDNLTTPVTQECLDNNVLLINEAGENTRFYPGSEARNISLTLRLPPLFLCSRCVLQMTYVSGNRQGEDISSGHSCLGCGFQEHFFNCADIEIVIPGTQANPIPDTPSPSDNGTQATPKPDNSTLPDNGTQANPKPDTPVIPDNGTQTNPKPDTPVIPDNGTQANPKPDTPVIPDNGTQANPKPDTPVIPDNGTQANPKPDTPVIPDNGTQANPKPDTPVIPDNGTQANPKPDIPVIPDNGTQANPKPDTPVIPDNGTQANPKPDNSTLPDTGNTSSGGNSGTQSGNVSQATTSPAPDKCNLKSKDFKCASRVSYITNSWCLQNCVLGNCNPSMCYCFCMKGSMFEMSPPPPPRLPKSCKSARDPKYDSWCETVYANRWCPSVFCKIVTNSPNHINNVE